MTVGEGAQGLRTYRFAAERVRESRDGQPGGEVWVLYKQNLDGTQGRTCFSNAPAETPLATLARVAMSRWPIETEFQNGKSQVALDEYEVRRWPGWQHHITMCLLAAAFLLTLQQEWGKKLPTVTRPQVHRIVHELLPRKRYTEEELLGWLLRTQARNATTKASHARRRERCRVTRDSLTTVSPGPSL